MIPVVGEFWPAELASTELLLLLFELASVVLVAIGEADAAATAAAAAAA